MAENYDIRPLQLKVLDILLAVDRVCREHQLRYYIIAGTLLGALRHRGFIPWDDDLDIGMPRKDYEIFMAHADTWLPAYYEAINGQNDPEYPLSFAKIQDARTTLIERKHLKYTGGIYIDLFPLDGVPENKLVQWWHYSRFAWYNKMLYFIFRDPYKHGKGVGSWVPLLARKLYTRSGIQTRLREMMMKYDFDESTKVCDYDDGRKGILPKAVFGNPTPLQFEGKEVWGPAQPDTYLSQKYGDYMIIPPKEKQRQHNFYYLDLNKPYSNRPIPESSTINH